MTPRAVARECAPVPSRTLQNVGPADGEEGAAAGWRRGSVLLRSGSTNSVTRCYGANELIETPIVGWTVRAPGSGPPFHQGLP